MLDRLRLDALPTQRQWPQGSCPLTTKSWYCSSVSALLATTSVRRRFLLIPLECAASPGQVEGRGDENTAVKRVCQTPHPSPPIEGNDFERILED